MKVFQQLTCLTLGRPNGPAYSIGELLNTPHVTGEIVPATHGAGTNKPDAPTPAYARVVSTDGYREAWTTRFTRLVAAPTVAEPSVSDRRRHEIDVVVDELAPLHQHVAVRVVRRHARRRQNADGYSAGTRQSYAVVQPISVPPCT